MTGARKVLYLNPFAEIGGAEMSLLETLRKLDRSRYQPTVVLPAQGPLVGRLQALGVEVVILSLRKLRRGNFLPFLLGVCTLARFIRARRIDLVHANAELANQYGVWAARIAGVPMICHTRRQILPRAFRWLFLAWADVLVANSRAVAASYADRVRRGQRVAVIYNGIDATEIERQAKGRAATHGGGRKSPAAVLLVVPARIHPTKGQDIFLRALAEAAWHVPHLCAVLAGDTRVDQSEDFLLNLRHLAASLSLADRVQFPGFVDDMPSLYAIADVVVLPSLEEPFGRVLIEAMALRKPVVATWGGGVPEVVEDGKTGLLVPPGDATALAEAIVHLASDPELRQTLGEKGRRRVESHFSIDRTVCLLQDLYDAILTR